MLVKTHPFLQESVSPALKTMCYRHQSLIYANTAVKVSSLHLGDTTKAQSQYKGNTNQRKQKQNKPKWHTAGNEFAFFFG